MSFRSGPVAYSRFQVSGNAPDSVSQNLLDQLAAGRLVPTEIGEPPEIESGFVAGRHILDGDFSSEHVAFGRFLLFGLRTDVNRVPTEVARAYRTMAEDALAAASATGFISRSERSQAKEEAAARCREELAAGKHRRSKMTPLLWDLSSSTLLAPVTSDSLFTQMKDLFVKSFDCRVVPLTSGSLAWNRLSDRGLTAALEDTRPSSFTKAPEGIDGQKGDEPAVTWCATGPEPKDYLGNEFLIWLWWLCEVDEGLVATTKGEVAITIDRLLETHSCWQEFARMTLAGDAPTSWLEATRGLQNGKWPRKCGMIMAAHGRQWEFTLQADRFILSAIKLPDIENASSPREELEQRLELITEMDELLVALYDTFLRQRFDASWDGRRQRISEWIRSRSPRRAARELVPA